MEFISKKHKDIIVAGKALFWKHGVKRVSVEEICRRSGVSKMTFYKYFSDKNSLAKCLLEEEMETSINTYSDLLGGDSSFEKKLTQIVLLKIEGLKGMSSEFINDVYLNGGEEIQKYIAEKSDESSQMFIAFFNDYQEKGFIRKSLKIELMIAMQTQIAELYKTEQLVAMYDSPKDFIVEMMNSILYGLMPVPTDKSM